METTPTIEEIIFEISSWVHWSSFEKQKKQTIQPNQMAYSGSQDYEQAALDPKPVYELM